MIAAFPKLVLTLDELESTFGVLFVGYIFSMVAYGFTFFQTYVYCSRYSMDHWAIKMTVIALCVLDTAASALMSHALYFYLVMLFPLTPGLINATSTYCAEIGLAASTLVVFIVQIFYSHRIWRASRNYIVAGSIALVSTAAFGLGIAMTVNMVNNTTFSNLGAPGVKGPIATGQALTFLAGLMSFCSLCFFLSPSRNDAIKPVEGWYNNFVMYTMSRCSAAIVVQLGYFITFVAMPTRAIWMPFHLVASKLFINSLFTMLNSREVVHGQGVYEEDLLSRRGNATTSCVGGRTNTSVRFDVVETKPGINVDTPHSSEGDNQFQSKVALGEEDDATNWRNTQFPGQKANMTL